MHSLSSRLMAAACCLSACMSGSSAMAAGDKAIGQQRAQACSGCHGSNGVSAVAGVPSLAGQQDNFLEWQLVFFRSGRRNNPIMTPLSQSLSDDDVKNIGAYFSSLSPPQPSAVQTDPLLTQGADIAQQHHCASCHTDSFAGKQGAARIADQREDYLRTALADYRSGARPSTGVAAMNEAASGLTDSDIAALAHFLATLH